MDKREEGWEAFQDGDGPLSNPYSGKDAEAWSAGWNSALKEYLKGDRISFLDCGCILVLVALGLTILWLLVESHV